MSPDPYVIPRAAHTSCRGSLAEPCLLCYDMGQNYCLVTVYGILACDMTFDTDKKRNNVF